MGQDLKTIQTVTGPIDPQALGFTLMHEHVNYTPYGSSVTHDWAEVARVAAEDLREFAAAGGTSYVDVTPIGAGRSAETIADVSRRSGVHIVAATGFYKGADLQALVGTTDVGELADILIGELTVGIDGSDIRAGIIKLGTSKVMTEDEHLAFQAGAIAHRQTGAGVITHTESGLLAVEQAEMLIGAGVDPSRIVIGHLLDLPDADLYRQLCRMGVTIGIDRIGKMNRPEDGAVEAISKMVEEGFAEQFILAHDAVLFRSGQRMPRVGPGDSAPNGKVKPRMTYTGLAFLPKLRRVGLTEAHIQSFVTETPRRILAY